MMRLALRLPVMLILLLLGCSYSTVQRDYRYTAISGGEKRQTLEMLKQNLNIFYVSYCGSAIGTAGAVVFDPKNDEWNLLGDGYRTVRDQTSVSGLISVMETYVQFNPLLYEIHGLDGRFYGYVYLAWYLPELKPIDDRTLMLRYYDAPMHLFGEGGSD